MSWRESFWLWALIPLWTLIGYLAFAEARRVRKMASAFGEPQSFFKMTTGFGSGRTLKALFRALVGTGLLVVLAGPQYGSRTTVLRQRGVDIVIALDFSKSMLARDVRPSRLERAKAEIMQLLTELEGDRVGIVAFAGETMAFPLTTDYSAIGLFLRETTPYDMPVGGTAIGRALVSAERLLERSAPNSGSRVRSRVVVLFTDGEDHEGDPESAAESLRDHSIKLITVGIGSRSGEPIPTYAPDGTWTGYVRDESGQPVLSALTEENEAQLTRIAETTGGRYFPAGPGGVGVDRIRPELRRLRRSEHQSRVVTVHEDRHVLVLLLTFLLWLGEGLIGIWPARTKGKAVIP